jgi:23S rRNA-/tRNA-specific pseudouridylate synthase
VYSSPPRSPSPGASRERGKGGEASRQMLHAWKLKITLPGEGAPREFEAPLAEDFESLLASLRR